MIAARTGSAGNVGVVLIKLATCVVLLAGSTTVHADMAEVLKCRSLSSDNSRLECYDRAVDGGLTPGVTGSGDWERTVETSPVDDSKRVVLLLNSKDTIRSRFGADTRPALVLRCSENTTVAYVNWGTYLGIGETTAIYRVDSNPAQTKRMSISTSHESAGYFRGASSIPFIRELLGGKSMYMQITPYGTTPVSVTFDIAGLDDQIGELRQACNW